jgi:hypothetical protein
VEVHVRRVFLAVLLCALLSPRIFSDQGHQHDLTDQELGSVHFATSCAKPVGANFNRAVALLHSFQYEQAGAAFTEIATKDPQCAMAHWGLAMSHYHGLWENSDLAAGQAAWQKAQETAAANPKTTPREKAYIAALGAIYSSSGDDMATRGRAFEQKMAEVQAANPDDSEAAIFHALTLYVAAPKTDKTFANQRKCGEILEPLFAKLPRHPGIAHYIIHCYDNPVLAAQGLDAARAYAKIAPASAHAHHMPSHIFTRVGSWDESIASNSRAAETAAAAEATSQNGEARDQRLHAFDYLEYAYLQSGRVALAKTVIEQMQSLSPIAGLTHVGDYALAAVPARYAIELSNWKDASELSVRTEGVPWTQAITWMAIGIGSARSGSLERARQAEQALASLRDATAKKGNEYWSKQIEVQRREVAAWVLEKRGKGDEALSAMRSAVDLEESMDKSPVTPGAITPARELLAELLALEHDPRQAFLEYETVLKSAPNRFNALYGAAQSAATFGENTTALEYYKKLTETTAGNERPEIETARKKLAE